MKDKSVRRFTIYLAVAILTAFAFACGKGDPASGSGADKLLGGKTAGKPGASSKKSAKTVSENLPKGRRWKSRVYRLRVRSAPTLKSDIVGHLHKGQLVAELERKKSVQTVAGRKGSWVKVQSEQGVKGWTFSGFLMKAEQ